MTAGCAARYRACSERSVAHFRNGPCLAACTRCTERCAGEDRIEGRCLGRCVGRACTTEELNHCAWDGPRYGADEAPAEGSARDAAAP